MFKILKLNLGIFCNSKFKIIKTLVKFLTCNFNLKFVICNLKFLTVFLRNKQLPYKYVKSVVIYDAAWFRDDQKKSFLNKAADVVWSDIAYKVIGCLLLVTGIGGGLMFSWPIVNSYVSLKIEKVGRFLVDISYKNRQATEAVAVEEKEEPRISFEDKQFIIEIEKIGLNSVVLANIDAVDPSIYTEALRQGVAHNKDSGLPGEGRAIYIFGHSTNYEWFVQSLNAVFYQLKDLQAGDTIILKQDDKILSYKVFEKVIVEAGETKILTENKDKEILILQTCYPPGTVLKRLLILAKPVN